MAIEYDLLNAAMAELRTMRQAYLDSYITLEEMEAAETRIKEDIREILGFTPPA